MKLSSADRKALIKLASGLPKGSEERRTILSGLKLSWDDQRFEMELGRLMSKHMVYAELDDVSNEAQVFIDAISMAEDMAREKEESGRRATSKVAYDKLDLAAGFAEYAQRVPKTPSPVSVSGNEVSFGTGDEQVKVVFLRVVKDFVIQVRFLDQYDNWLRTHARNDFPIDPYSEGNANTVFARILKYVREEVRNLARARRGSDRTAFNKENPSELIAQLVKVLKRADLVDAASRVKGIATVVQSAWNDRER